MTIHTIEHCQTTSSGGRTPSIELRFSSIPSLMPAICHAVQAFVTGTAMDESPKLELILQELLANAIEHGNAGDPARTIICRTTKVDDTSVEVAITDEGQGFDVDALDLSFRDLPADSHRKGLCLVNALCESLRFELGGRRAVCRVSWDERYVGNTQAPAGASGRKEC